MFNVIPSFVLLTIAFILWVMAMCIFPRFALTWFHFSTNKEWKRADKARRGILVVERVLAAIVSPVIAPLNRVDSLTVNVQKVDENAKSHGVTAAGIGVFGVIALIGGFSPKALIFGAVAGVVTVFAVKATTSNVNVGKAKVNDPGTRLSLDMRPMVAVFICLMGAFYLRSGVAA
jgi:hypothetical protein